MSSPQPILGTLSGPLQRTVLALVTVLGPVGCSAIGGPGSLPPAASQAPASSSLTADPSPAATPGPRFVFEPEVVLDGTLAGTTDLYVNPGALIESGGRLHLFPNLFSTWPGEMRIPHLTSADGDTWTLDEEAPIITSDDSPLASPGMDVSTGYVADDGTWVLIYETVTTSQPWLLAQATAPGPQGRWAFDEEPILRPGAAGDFDVGGVQWPWVVEHDGKLLLYYAGFDAIQGGSGKIGLATLGADGTWTKRAAPVLEPTETWEGRSVDRPRVVATPGGLVMVYAGRDLTDRGIATSPDGITWTKLPGPAIERDDFPVTGRSWDAALLYRDGTLTYLLEIGSQTTKVYRATLPWP